MNGRDKDKARGILCFVGLVAAVILIAVGFGWQHKSETKTAAGFVHETGIGNQFEILSSQAALEKSQNDAVKQFAQKMIDDHTKAGRDLSTAVADTTVKVPAGQMDARHRKILDDLNGKVGADFDKEYVKAQVDAHDATVAMFDGYVKEGDNDILKNFAAQTLPTLQEHQKHIKQIASTL